MYSIGVFSKMSQVTPKTLRHYDEIGLLVPCHIDQETGYRYYSGEELSRMHRITALKQMGLSLSEITHLLEETCDESTKKDILLGKKQEILASIEEGGHRITLIDNYLQQNKRIPMNYTVKIKSIPQCIIASLRRVISNYGELNYLMPCVLGAEMKRLGCICAKPDYCFNIYHHDEYRETDIDVEMCQAVTAPCTGSDIIVFKTLPPVETCVSLLHKGPYADTELGLCHAYAFAFEWLEKNGYELSERPRESYIDGIWNKETEAEWLTELQFPVKKKDQARPFFLP